MNNDFDAGCGCGDTCSRFVRHRMGIDLWLALLVISLVAHCAGCEEATITATGDRAFWQVLATFFQPTPEFRNHFGSYRSPLLFEDGALVKSAADWARRRKEILAQWHELMGQWPAILEKPKVDFLSESRRDNHTQHLVRIQIAPQQRGDGWLLVPEGNGPFPAVLVLFYEPEPSI